MAKTVYRSGIDWWVWAVLLFVVAVVVFIAIDSTWYVWVPYSIFLIGLIVWGLFGTWYEIDGDTLTVYCFFRPNRMPIDKIAEVRYCRGYLATAGMSLRRLSIKFTDRSVLKSYMPLEISPKDRSAFVAQLLSVNPAIKVIGSDDC